MPLGDIPERIVSLQGGELVKCIQAGRHGTSGASDDIFLRFQGADGFAVGAEIEGTLQSFCLGFSLESEVGSFPAPWGVKSKWCILGGWTSISTKVTTKPFCYTI